jgi:hypothetical protein
MDMAAMPSADRPKHWIFCSSGARALYLENVVRVLALPRGEVVKFRYEENIVAGTFKDLVGNCAEPFSVPVVGDIAYLCYLDNRNKLTLPRAFPVREATIYSVTILGTTYVIQLMLRCFINWHVDKNLDQTIRAHALDDLVHWTPEGETNPERIDHAGNWVAAAKPLPDEVFCSYCPTTRSHLKAFESSVRAISSGTDFSDGKRLFISVLALYDAEHKTLIEKEPLRAGRAYELFLYHYKSGDGTHNPLEKFRLKASTDNDDVAVVGFAERHIEARYDEVVFPFRVKEDAKDGPINLNIDVWRTDTGPNGASDQVYILRGAIRRQVKSNRHRKLGFGLLIGLGLFGTQAVTLFSAAKLTPSTFIAALAFSLLAGMGAAFQFKTKV